MVLRMTAAKKISKKGKCEDRPLIGLTEFVTLVPETGRKKRIKARIDTGAHSNSIDSKLAAEMNLGPIVKTTMVKSANGQSLRPVLEVKIIMAKNEIKGRFTIADRSRMKYKILVGRNILSKAGFLIDPKKP